MENKTLISTILPAKDKLLQMHDIQFSIMCISYRLEYINY